MAATHPLTVSLIQSSLFWEDKKANLDMFEEKISIVPDSAEVVILPEMFSTGFTMIPDELAEDMSGETVSWMRRMAIQHKLAIAGSIIIREDGKYFNRLIWMLPTGTYGYYDKRHLFSYAGEHERYHGGNKKLIASIKGWKLNLQVCYDLRFPVWARQPAESEKRYDIYINIASWPSKRRHAWKTLLTARAIENQSFVIGVNRVGEDGNGHHYSGDSMIVGPLGEEIYCKEDAEDIFTYTFTKEALQEVRSHFPFLADADAYLVMNEG